MSEPDNPLNHDEQAAPQVARKLDLPGVRALLEKSHGREYWRSLEDLAQTDAFQDLMHREFPRYASEWEDGDSRRNFIDRKSTRLNSSHLGISYAAFCLKKKNNMRPGDGAGRGWLLPDGARMPLHRS